jgi:hypothetical protein
VADSKQFGSSKILQFWDKAGANQPDSGHCARCEAMLADALDGTLSAAEQELFDVHMACCTPCSQMLADARRGVAWLEMLRTPKPEPPAALLERILAQTSGAAAVQMVPQHGFNGATIGQPQPFDLPVMAPGYTIPTMAASSNVLPFPRRIAARLRASSFGQIALQPRLAMTAAMAFFSIALTLDLTGVRLQNLRVSDLRPSSLKRAITDTNARVVQYYEGLRVVYELESRVHDLQSASDDDTSAGTQSTPQSTPQNTTPSQPKGKSPSANPDQPGKSAPANQSPTAQPNQKQRPPSGPSAGQGPNSGASRRERSARPLSLATLVVTDRVFSGLTNAMIASTSEEGILV